MISGQKITPELVPGLGSNSGLLAIAVVMVLAVLVVMLTRGHLGYERERATRPKRAEWQPNRAYNNQSLWIAVCLYLGAAIRE